MKNLPKRLYFITGKGGVGKSTVALALTTFLCQEGYKAEYWSLEKVIDLSLLTTLKITHREISSQESMRTYAQMKFGHIIGNWIVGTTFFQAFVKMLPSISLLLSLGYMIDDLKRHPDKIIVFDSPSSGHALVMLEAVNYYREIFGSGILYEDLALIRNALRDPYYFKVWVVSLPNPLALQEANEVQQKLSLLLPEESPVIINSCLSAILGIQNLEKHSFPAFIQKKIDLEHESLQKWDQNKIIPYFSTTHCEKLVLKLGPWICKWV